LSYNYAVF